MNLSDSDIKYIKDNYNTQSRKDIARHIGCCETTVYAVLKKFGLQKIYSKSTEPRNWTTDEKLFLLENHGKMSNADIAKHLGRKLSCIYAKYNVLSHGKQPIQSKRAWKYENREIRKSKYVRLSKDEKQYIIDNANNKSITSLADWIGCSTATVYYHIRKMSGL